ncbi:hypothetical protein JZY91_01945 [Corynebacterium sp. CNCTC7651]|uniref:S1 family peptidase n=1 Tax=Corynebacterium sp. CNCTC7651 TaxID=2815361 RepID=UPI001F429846|nr:S1 family peptidase [Corynebacterium sp. CNCTC7651]UIZ92589.1 hypothetical protein JZY91_01945 [Corynebacterium sp. CNCTC7651]
MRKTALMVAAAVLASANVPALAAEVQVRQGDRVRVGEYTYCTLGFNDRQASVGYTAAHCGRGGDRVAVQVGDEFVEAGTFYPSTAYGESVSGNDWAMIQWDAGVRLGENRFTGDDRLPANQLQPGDRICTYGAATGAPSCGTYAGALGGNVYWDQSPAMVGDSGGAVFVDGRRGFVGVLSGHSVVAGRQGEHTVLRASVPENLPAPTAEAEITLISDFYRDNQPMGLIVSTPMVNATQAAGNIAGRVEERLMESSSERGTATSSGWEAGTLSVIATILVGVLVAATPALVEIIDFSRALRAR